MSDQWLKIISEQVSRLDTKIDAISGDITEIKVTSGRHEENLKTHMKRSDLAEKGINILKEEMIPLKKRVIQTDTIIKFILTISSLIGVAVGILKFLKR
jgi:archaellum component FlaC